MGVAGASTGEASSAADSIVLCMGVARVAGCAAPSAFELSLSALSKISSYSRASKFARRGLCALIDRAKCSGVVSSGVSMGSCASSDDGGAAYMMEAYACTAPS